MKRILVPGALLFAVLSSFAFLIISIQTSAPRSPEAPSSVLTDSFSNAEEIDRPPERFGVVVTAQELADHYRLPVPHPFGQEPIEEIRLDCEEVSPSGRIPGRCHFAIYYANGYYLRVITEADVLSGWEERWANDGDPLGIYTLVTVRGLLGVGRDMSTAGDQLNPNGWPAYLVWYDPSSGWLTEIVWPSNLQSLLSFANGPRCTLATPAGVEPPVSFC